MNEDGEVFGESPVKARSVQRDLLCRELPLTLQNNGIKLLSEQPGEVDGIRLDQSVWFTFADRVDTGSVSGVPCSGGGLADRLDHVDTGNGVGEQKERKERNGLGKGRRGRLCFFVSKRG